ncbi:MAG TPA: hypothetical protein VFL69_10535 [Marmoricola sp.]|nr:hypothetical protein [Marmoricola sp.]
MESGIRERLADLAEEAPPRLEADLDLWQQGRALRRRRTALNATATVVALVALAGLVGLVLPAGRPGVAPASGQVGMPEVFYKPSPWLPGTDDEGPLGQLVAVQVAARKGWFSASEGVVGVSAATGEYRFLDLPGLTQDPTGQVALSPDGRHVAYWATGPISGTPDTEDTDGARPPAGVAIYDTATGDVQRALVPTRHGLTAYSLTWLDDEHVVMAFGQYLGAHGERAGMMGRGRARLLTLGRHGSSRVAPGADVGFATLAGNGHGMLVVNDYARRFGVVEVRHPRVVVAHRLSEPVLDDLVLDPTGSRVAGIYPGPHPERTSGNSHRPLLVGAVGGGRMVRLHQVPRYRFTGRVVGWVDPQHVLARAHRPPSYDPRFESVDVRSGQVRTVTVLRSNNWGIELAGDLLGAPPVAGHRPPSPWDPRAKAFLGLLCVLALGWGAERLWRVRRVRA